MKHFAVGDIQGCYTPLRRVLDKARFNPEQDELWVAGDMVNRGPDNLSTLRFLKELGPRCHAVLGNHDLHLLAIAYGDHAPKRKDTITDILDAPDCDELLLWLRHRPLLHLNLELGYVMTHAGIPPQWSLADAVYYAGEVESVLRSKKRFHRFFRKMYGNKPTRLKEKHTGMKRLRMITNYFTRMRFCTPEGKLDFDAKSGTEHAPEGMAPWYTHPHSLPTELKVLFGHWAALQGKTSVEHVIALDTGCVWGGPLTLQNLASGKRYQSQWQR